MKFKELSESICLMTLALILTGCEPLRTTDCIKNTALDSCSYNQSGKVTDKDIFGKQAAGIKKAIDAALINEHSWNGKHCNMHIDFTIDGDLQNIIVKDGDAEYCAALVDAAKRAKFPPFANQHVFDVMGSARWNMEGQP
ncbi:cell envelope integrity TolA C-terminal domain-containing protein [Serratia marcescens]|jgi:colicin import membrane protein|uniref:cell envelope integrity TolA C-terminal domain-containing protein n=1 Tax=Serratia marcescens TaxID=615 RepID=UPI0024A61951|nr:cell envelope integrity TolA C-terminal domain-containing protein [Serratia marcescens]